MKNFLQQQMGIVIISATVIIAVIIASIAYTQKGMSHQDIISVTGSSITSVVSDKAKFSATVKQVTTADAMAEGYKNIAKDAARLQQYVIDFGFSPEEITLDPVAVSEIWQDPEYAQGPKEYELYRHMTVHSNKVDEVTRLGQEISVLGEEGMFLQINSIEYFYSKLAEARVDLLSKAMEDAYLRAQVLVKGMHTRIGGLSSVSAGLVQVRQPNSTDTSDYGMYDTSTKEKEIMVTVHADLFLK